MSNKKSKELENFLEQEISNAIKESRRGNASDGMLAKQSTDFILRRLNRSEGKKSNSGSSQASYLRLIRSILDSVRRGVSRSQFLNSIFEELHQHGDESHRKAILLEAHVEEMRNEKTIVSLDAPLTAGISRGSIEKFEKRASDMRKSSFIKGLIFQRQLLDFAQSTELSEEYEGKEFLYSGELSSFYENRAWICAIPLPAGEAGEPERSLVLVHEMVDKFGSVRIPPGAQQEWEILLLVPEIFNLLQFRIRSMRELVDTEQRQRILELAPSAITHELGTNLGIMEASLKRIPSFISSISKKITRQDSDLIEIAKDLSQIAKQIQQAKRTTDAFTNLERRNPQTQIRVSKLVEEIEVVLERRLQIARIDIRKKISRKLEIRTDLRYVTHIIMNVIINAIEAIELECAKEEVKGTTTNKRRHKIAIVAQKAKDNVEIFIANDGPSIPPEISARVFEKGVTTKPLGVGHGQGLFLCRQIAANLDGSFGFGSAPSILPKATVTFALSIPQYAVFESDS